MAVPRIKGVFGSISEEVLALKMHFGKGPCDRVQPCDRELILRIVFRSQACLLEHVSWFP